MGWTTPVCRRGFLVALAGMVLTGCGKLPALRLAKAPSTDPRETVQSYFTLLTNQRFDDARRLMTVSFQERLGRETVDALLRSIKVATVTEIVDAVAWANHLGARIPSPPNDRREYLVTLRVDPAPDVTTWSAGTNRRFVDLLNQDGFWQVDGIDVTPGTLVTGQTVSGVKPGPAAVTIPVAPLRTGPVPIDPVIYGARQRAADRGDLPWATDPVEVTRRDGPSFGIDPRDPLVLDGEERDPVSLNQRAIVRVLRGSDALQVTLDQPIRRGAGGVWAIAAVVLAPGHVAGALDGAATSR